MRIPLWLGSWLLSDFLHQAAEPSLSSLGPQNLSNPLGISPALNCQRGSLCSRLETVLPIEILILLIVLVRAQLLHKAVHRGSGVTAQQADGRGA